MALLALVFYIYSLVSNSYMLDIDSRYAGTSIPRSEDDNGLFLECDLLTSGLLFHLGK